MNERLWIFLDWFRERLGDRNAWLSPAGGPSLPLVWVCVFSIVVNFHFDCFCRGLTMSLARSESTSCFRTRSQRLLGIRALFRRLFAYGAVGQRTIAFDFSLATRMA